MKNLIFGLIAIVMFSTNTNASELSEKPTQNEIKIENAGKGKIIKYVIAAVSWLFGDDDPESVSAIGAYKNKECDARNTNTCNINFRIGNTIPIDVKNSDSNSTILNSNVMKKVIEFNITFLSFDENGGLYLTSPINTNDKLFTSGQITQTYDAIIESDVLDRINVIIHEINPRAQKFTGIKKGKVLVPETSEEDGFIYIKLN